MLIKHSDNFRIEVSGSAFVDVGNTYWNQAIDIRLYEFCSYIVLAERDKVIHLLVFSSKASFDYWLDENKGYEIIFTRGKIGEEATNESHN